MGEGYEWRIGGAFGGEWPLKNHDKSSDQIRYIANGVDCFGVITREAWGTVWCYRVTRITAKADLNHDAQH